MSKLANYLQEHLRGEVVSASSVRATFSTDSSILQVTPEMVIFPFNVSDIRKLARFTWQLAEKGHVLPVTVRGGGTDQTGAAIGKGAIVSLPAHMNMMLEFDTKQRLVRVQPGLTCKALQTIMLTHGFTVPVLEDAPEGMTIGGAIANNYSGSNGYKYGSMRDWVDQTELVLANGEVIQSGRINKRDLEKRKGLPTLEGEIYRQIDGLINDNPELVGEMANSMSNVGYALDQVKQKDGSFDILPLIAGSQGSLGIVSEVILKVIPHVPQGELVIVAMPAVAEAHDALDEIRKLQPSKVEMLDGAALTMIQKLQPNRLAEFFGEGEGELPALLYFIEFDDKHAGKNAKRVEKLFSKAGSLVVRADSYDQRMAFWQLFKSSIALLKTNEKDGKMALPIMQDVAITDDKFQVYLDGVAALAAKYRASWPVYGHAADGRFSVLPSFDLRKLSDRQKALKAMDDYYTMTAELGGVVAASSGEGRLHAPCATKQYSTELQDLFSQVKQAFDPFGTFNPGAKQLDLKGLLPLVRDSYSGFPFV
jgi:FAD/FMN-containing dehydrogenase